MKFFGSPMSLCIGTVSLVTGANGGESGTLPMNQTSNIIMGKNREKSRGTRRKMNVRCELRWWSGLDVRYHRVRCRRLRLAVNKGITSLLLT
jgi:hypothetical protein